MMSGNVTGHAAAKGGAAVNHVHENAPDAPEPSMRAIVDASESHFAGFPNIFPDAPTDSSAASI